MRAFSSGVRASNASGFRTSPFLTGADYNVNFVNKATALDGQIPGKYRSKSINVGTKVTPYAAVEAFGELSNHVNKGVFHSEYGAYGVDAFGVLPLGCYGEWEVLGTAGIGRYRFEEKVKPHLGHVTLHEWGYRLGAGVQYNITENWGVRAMYRHIAFVNKDPRGFDTLSFGVRYAF